MQQEADARMLARAAAKDAVGGAKEREQPLQKEFRMSFPNEQRSSGVVSTCANQYWVAGSSRVYLRRTPTLPLTPKPQTPY